jgi:hypothetical protein
MRSVPWLKQPQQAHAFRRSPPVAWNPEESENRLLISQRYNPVKKKMNIVHRLIHLSKHRLLRRGFNADFSWHERTEPETTRRKQARDVRLSNRSAREDKSDVIYNQKRTRNRGRDTSLVQVGTAGWEDLFSRSLKKGRNRGKA